MLRLWRLLGQRMVRMSGNGVPGCLWCALSANRVRVDGVREDSQTIYGLQRNVSGLIGRIKLWRRTRPRVRPQPPVHVGALSGPRSAGQSSSGRIRRGIRSQDPQCPIGTPMTYLVKEIGAASKKRSRSHPHLEV